MIAKFIERLGEINPQLFRESAGRLKPRNLAIASAVSIVSQILILTYYYGLIPSTEAIEPVRNRYCFGSASYRDNFLCTKDLLNNWTINWQLWWLDVFLCMSIVGIFVLLVTGVYLLIADLAKEESRGTLNFIRLAPQSSSSILAGKILGVPIVVYLMSCLAIPLHLAAGLAAGISFPLLAAFYGVLVLSCAFFYSAALLFALVNSGLAGFKPWFGSGLVFMFLLAMTGVTMHQYGASQTPWDWLGLFYPGKILSYLIDNTYLPSRRTYFDSGSLDNLLFYGQNLWLKASTGIGFIVCNYLLWTYWIWQGLKRRFHNPTKTVLSKTQSYWLTGCFTAVNVGFALQTAREYRLYENFLTLQCFSIAFFLLLISALSPDRQTLQDWARYRHQASKKDRFGWKELIINENSPSTGAIALNLLIATAYTLPALTLFPGSKYALAIFWGLILNANIILIYAAIAQWLLLQKTQKRAIWASLSVLFLSFAPIVGLAIFGVAPQYSAFAWLFTSLPALATQYASTNAIYLSILGQWLAIAAIGFQMTRQLKQLGASETKALLSARK